MSQVTSEKLRETVDGFESVLIPTGVNGLDALMGGGIPSGRAVLVLGEPGAGKTTLCSQFLANGYSRYNENGVYVSLEETRIQLFREMKRYGIDFAGAEKGGQFALVDASPLRHVPDMLSVGSLRIGKKEFSLVSLMDSVKRAISSVDAKRVVVDPLSYLIFQYTDPAELRTALLDLIGALSELNVTVLMATELRRTGAVLRDTSQMEEFVAHGTIVMQSVLSGKTILRTIQIPKMRECEVDRQPRPYRITSKGVEVFPKETIL